MTKAIQPELNDSLDDLFGAPAREFTPTLPANYVSAEDRVFEEKCIKCHGRGRFISYAGRDCGPCFHCKGKGKQTFKTSAQDRARARARDNSQARAEKKAADAWRAFSEDHPSVATWILASMDGFEFAKSMHEAVLKFGSLTERQIAACNKCILARQAKIEQRAAEKVAQQASAKEISIQAIEAAFARAKANGAARPKLRLDTFKFAMAPASGRNAGSIYVTEDDEYLGKVTGGKFFSQNGCTDEKRERILAAAANPASSAKAYGLKMGRCSVCGRDLTDPVSVANGIGPICAEGWGF